ncbi:DNA-binding protein [Collimonas silvisoli]|uniref:DNA-binding protein n=1 Tax=Collimonas silvisoli TaxID=2825884 RepID=UPI001E572802|nr:DNA-binding protein [Collimonas silvisoli]
MLKIDQLYGRAAVPMLTTEQLAEALSLKPNTLRSRFSKTGTYFGLRPVKLPNGKLRWAVNAVELLTKGIA